LSYREYLDWMEFFALEPPLSERVDLAGALVSTTLANIHRGRGARSRSIEDFMLISRGLRERERDPVRDEEAHFFATMAALGASVHG